MFSEVRVTICVDCCLHFIMWPQTLDPFERMKILLSYALTFETMVSGFDAIINISSDSLSKYAVFIFSWHISYPDGTNCWQASPQQNNVIKHSTKIPLSWTIRCHLLLDLLAEFLNKGNSSLPGKEPTHAQSSPLVTFLARSQNKSWSFSTSISIQELFCLLSKSVHTCWSSMVVTNQYLCAAT